MADSYCTALLIKTEIKICTKCNEKKPATPEFFHAYKRSPDGRRSVCKVCRAADHAARKDEHAARRKEFYTANKDRLLADSRRYYQENIEHQRELGRNRHHRNREHRLAVMREYQAKNREALLESKRVRELKRWRELYGTDAAYTLRHRMRSLFRVSLAKRKKSGRMFDLLGYTLEDLRSHLERQFTGGMSWARFMSGEIHVDHIIPVSRFNITSCECDEFKRCWSLSNLRPLWAKENLSKAGKLTHLI